MGEMITPGLHPLCQLLSIYKFEILHHSILGNSDKRRDFDPTVLEDITLQRKHQNNGAPTGRILSLAILSERIRAERIRNERIRTESIRTESILCPNIS